MNGHISTILTMPPPCNRPDGESGYRVPGKRLLFWFRQSDRHLVVDSRPSADGMIAIDDALRRVRSRSPDTERFSRFSSRPATPDVAERNVSSQHQIYSFPPPPPPFPHQHITQASVLQPQSSSSRDRQGEDEHLHLLHRLITSKQNR